MKGLYILMLLMLLSFIGCRFEEHREFAKKKIEQKENHTETEASQDNNEATISLTTSPFTSNLLTDTISTLDKEAPKEVYELLNAIQHNKLSDAAKILKTVNPNIVIKEESRYGSSNCYKTMLNYHPSKEMYELLLRNGLDIHRTDNKRNTFLHFLAHHGISSGSKKGVFEHLCQELNVNRTNDCNIPPLFWAIQKLGPDYQDTYTDNHFVKILLDNGADVTLEDEKGYTAFTYALFLKYYGVKGVNFMACWDELCKTISPEECKQQRQKVNVFIIKHTGIYMPFLFDSYQDIIKDERKLIVSQFFATSIKKAFHEKEFSFLKDNRMSCRKCAMGASDFMPSSMTVEDNIEDYNKLRSDQLLQIALKTYEIDEYGRKIKVSEMMDNNMNENKSESSENIYTPPPPLPDWKLPQSTTQERGDSIVIKSQPKKFQPKKENHIEIRSQAREVIKEE